MTTEKQLVMRKTVCNVDGDGAAESDSDVEWDLMTPDLI